MACEHFNFDCMASVGQLSEVDGGPITGYTVGIKVNCRECGMAFRFIGLQAGSHYAEPRVSVDGTELRAPLEPSTHERFAPSASYVMPSGKKH